MRYLVIDLEMSGPDPDYHDIIQLSAIFTDLKWNSIDEYDTLIYPDNPDAFSVYAEEVHGINIHELEDAPTMDEALEDFTRWVKGHFSTKNDNVLRNVVCAGHTVYNDVAFLRSAYVRHHLSWPFSYKILDLVSIAHFANRMLRANGYETPSSYSLDSIAEYFDIEREGENHDALEDAKITLECFKGYFDIADMFTLKDEENVE